MFTLNATTGTFALKVQYIVPDLQSFLPEPRATSSRFLPLTELEPTNPEDRLGEDISPLSGDCPPLEGLCFKARIS